MLRIRSRDLRWLALVTALAWFGVGCDDGDTQADGDAGQGGEGGVGGQGGTGGTGGTGGQGGTGGTGGTGGQGGAPVELPDSYPAMPYATNGFGATIHGDRLYVYGGHLGPAHAISTDNIMHHTLTLDLLDPAAEWRETPLAEPRQQGSIFVWDDTLYRAGGMTVLNPPGADTELYSVTELQRWDAASEAWVDLPPIPGDYGRASHAHALIGSDLYLTGGWILTGASGSGEYQQSVLHIDLADLDAGWDSIPMDFTLRDHCAGALGGRIWMIGGMTADTTWPDVPRIYDPEAGTWSEGPALPLEVPIKGFGCAATVYDGRLYMTSADGIILRLAEDESTWETVTRIPLGRIFAGLVGHRDRLLIVGGGIGRDADPVDTVEIIPLD